MTQLKLIYGWLSWFVPCQLLKKKKKKKSQTHLDVAKSNNFYDPFRYEHLSAAAMGRMWNSILQFYNFFFLKTILFVFENIKLTFFVFIYTKTIYLQCWSYHSSYKSCFWATFGNENEIMKPINECIQARQCVWHFLILIYGSMVFCNLALQHSLGADIYLVQSKYEQQQCTNVILCHYVTRIHIYMYYLLPTVNQLPREFRIYR